MQRVAVVVGARPNFVKVAPVCHALRAEPDIAVEILHTGQHYDRALSGTFLEQLGLPAPTHHLGVGLGHARPRRRRRSSPASRPCWRRTRPRRWSCPGDVNSTLGATLAAAKLGVPVAHLEAGLRSGDRTMPEEINRIVTDRLAELLLVHCDDAVANLRREGMPGRRPSRSSATR